MRFSIAKIHSFLSKTLMLTPDNREKNKLTTIIFFSIIMWVQKKKKKRSMKLNYNKKGLKLKTSL
jgi:hypothetical protein